MTVNPANDNHATRVLAGFAPCVPARLQELFAAHYAPEGFREQVLLLTRGLRPAPAVQVASRPAALASPARVCVA